MSRNNAISIGHSSESRPKALSSVTFILYCVYTIDYYIRLSSRVPALAAARPTLLLFILIVLLLLLQQPHLRGRLENRSAKALFAFFAYLALSLPFVTWPGSVLHNLDNFTRVVSFFFFSALLVDTERRLFVFLTVFVGCQVYRVLDPLYLHVTTGYLGDTTYLGDGNFAGRLSGGPYDVVNPNGLGFVIVGCVPFLYYVLYGSKQLYRKVLAIALIAACLYALYLTLSRGSMVALFVVIWAIFRQTKHKVLFVAGMVAVCVVAWAHFGSVQKDRYLSLLGEHGSQGSVQAEEDQTAYGRVQVTEEEFDIGMQRPIFGHGLGTTQEAKVHDGHGPQASHNLYTELLVEIGVVGAFFFFRFLYSIYRELKEATTRLAQDEGRPDDDIYRRIFQALVALFWTYLVFSANYWGLSQDYWYALAGLVTVCARQIRPMEIVQADAAITRKPSLPRGIGRLRAPQIRPRLIAETGRSKK
jgi:putative inorganic carbon (HCO3(-)) transporter